MANAIGVFDSGIGGLTVASAIKQQCPDQRIIYFGDTAHLPYGDKSAEHIQHYIKAISAFLFEQGCDRLVVACNSASSTLHEVQDLPAFRHIVNVIDPVVGQVASIPEMKTIGVIGTKRTIDSNVYLERLSQVRPDLEIHQLATPLLAPMIEEGFINNAIAEQVVHEYLTDLPKLDGLILGCTHYPLISKEIDEFYNGEVRLFEAPDLVSQLICDQKGDAPKDTPKADHFYVSDYTRSFEQTAQRFFGARITLEKSNLFEY